MRYNWLVYFFILLGLAAAGLCVYMALQPSTGYYSRTGTYPINENMRFGSLATGIISAACFIAASIFSKNK